jgi:hypothetical protein
LQAAWGDPEGLGDEVHPTTIRPPLVRASERALVRDQAQARALGEQVAARLRAAGARPVPAA